MGGRPFPDGDEPDNHSRGSADEEFATAVFDEAFVRAAHIHEPSAAERSLRASRARAETDAARAARAAGAPGEDDLFDSGRPPGAAGVDDQAPPYEDPYGPYGGSLRPYRDASRWHRPVAWVLAVVMGIGMVALAFTAVYRGAADQREPGPPPATSGVEDRSGTGSPAGSPDPVGSLPPAPGPQTVSAVPRSG